MSSLITPDQFAVRLENVSKIYRLHSSQLDQLIDVMHLQRFGFRTRSTPREFAALSNVSLCVPKGQRLGIVGRNGAGKTTLLKLICGNFQQTKGRIQVNGDVQALMSVGLGFHPDYSGRQNIEASLQYNGLPKKDYDEALSGVVEFCELGEFLDQPFRTYSLGMQARLMFAAATAIRPDILIVDEVLGAGDAYFVAKSKLRIDRLVESGCTMLLVSHSMQQVLELCDEAVWLDKGMIRMSGDAFQVVKSYEEYLHGATGLIVNSRGAAAPPRRNREDLTIHARKSNEDDPTKLAALPDLRGDIGPVLQEPMFQPNSREDVLTEKRSAEEFSFTTDGGISRWAGDQGVKISGFSIFSDRGETNVLSPLCPVKFVIKLRGEVAGEYKCRYGIAVHNVDGACVTRIFSPCDHFVIERGEDRQVEILLNPLQIGPGRYTLGISVSDYTQLERINDARRFDLLSRSFEITVELPESLRGVSGDFFHSAEWSFIRVAS